MPIDPRELARFKHVQPSVIMHDRECARCGYNLKGLKTGSVCPECGTPMPAMGSAARLRDSIADAPQRYLRGLMTGLSLMVLGSVGGVIVLVGVVIGRVGGMPGAVLLCAAGCVWWLGVFITSGERSTGPNAAKDAVLESGKLRLANRIIQASWAVAGLALMGVVQTTGKAAIPFQVVAAFGPLIGLAGLMPLSVHLSSLADWSGYTSLGDRFRATAWGIAACGIVVLGAFVLQKLTVNFAGFLALAFGGTVLVLLLAQLVFVISLLQLVSTVLWAIRNAEFAAEREVRRVERLKRGSVGSDRHCEKCGYSLEGLSLLVPCPECGWQDPEVRGSNMAALSALRPKERRS